MNLVVFLKLPRDEMANLIIKYLVGKKLSNQYKNLMNALSTHMNMLFTLIISLIQWDRQEYWLTSWLSQLMLGIPNLRPKRNVQTL